MSPLCPYHQYYIWQAGNGIGGAIYKGSVYQRGHGLGSVTDGKTNEGLARPPRIPEFVANQLGATTYTRLLVFVCF
jgi:hypothetical protein